jgi:hypothetical protein
VVKVWDAVRHGMQRASVRERIPSNSTMRCLWLIYII